MTLRTPWLTWKAESRCRSATLRRARAPRRMAVGTKGGCDNHVCDAEPPRCQVGGKEARSDGGCGRDTEKPDADPSESDIAPEWIQSHSRPAFDMGGRQRLQASGGPLNGESAPFEEAGNGFIDDFRMCNGAHMPQTLELDNLYSWQCSC
jgi:hypothetical protein